MYYSRSRYDTRIFYLILRETVARACQLLDSGLQVSKFLAIYLDRPHLGTGGRATPIRDLAHLPPFRTPTSRSDIEQAAAIGVHADINTCTWHASH